MIIRSKGATNYAIGLAAARILEALLYDQRSVLPVSSPLDGGCAMGDVCLRRGQRRRACGARELVRRKGGELRLAGRRPAAFEAVLPA